jgi:hypothetical protein
MYRVQKENETKTNRNLLCDKGRGRISANGMIQETRQLNVIESQLFDTKQNKNLLCDNGRGHISANGVFEKTRLRLRLHYGAAEARNRLLHVGPASCMCEIA